MNSITGRSICRVQGVSQWWPTLHHLSRWNVCNPGQRYPTIQMPPNLPLSHTAPRLTLRRQNREQNVHKSGLDQKHANYTNYAWLCYPSHAYIHNTNISHIHSSSPPNADCKFLLVAVGGIGSTCSFLQRSCLTHQCRPKIWQIYPIHLNSMPPPFL